MPEMSGMGFTGRAQALARARRPLHLRDGRRVSTDAKRFIEESVCAVIQKPFRVEELMALIERKAREGGGLAPVESGPLAVPAGLSS